MSSHKREGSASGARPQLPYKARKVVVAGGGGGRTRFVKIAQVVLSGLHDEAAPASSPASSSSVPVVAVNGPGQTAVSAAQSTQYPRIITTGPTSSASQAVAAAAGAAAAPASGLHFRVPQSHQRSPQPWSGIGHLIVPQRARLSDDTKTTQELHVCAMIGCDRTFNTQADLYVHHTQDHPVFKAHQQRVTQNRLASEEAKKARRLPGQKRGAGGKRKVCCQEPGCDKEVLSKSYLRHLLSCRGIKPHQCLECGRCFTTRSTLKIHAAIHTDQFPYECPICQRRFRQPASVWFCRRKHDGEQLPCPKCDKTFAIRGWLNAHLYQKHQLAPDGKTPREHTHKCPRCPRTFAQTSDMQKHLLVHGMGTYMERVKCPECPRTFTLPGSMQAHLRHVHGVVERKACPHCTKTFARTGDLNLHLRKKHNVGVPIERKTCPYCPKTFGRTSSLNVHLRKFHPDTQ